MKKLIKLYTAPCAPCQAVGNYLENELQVKHHSVHVEEHPEVAAHYELASVPTVILVEVENEDDVIGTEIKRSMKFVPDELDELAELLVK
ncbi:thioredoxin [Bacillus phage AaronPhadgers]|uniref:thioredoxin family protein n=1 Tax=Bacillus phage Zuko TaxID=1805956 RepID=UPI0007A777D1|nr:thioredoxin family protein [Bacillus phage Zuko]AMW62555.1 thioredoxin [Bacillus phage Zuko]ASR78799.1 thioredoxin [Bacillus phage AaronPhadgers]AXF42006.1 thioredoxin [Bacillus phage Saddex]